MAMNPRLLRPIASVDGFNFRAISGLSLWLDASDRRTLGSTSTSSGGAVNNGPVRWWGDKSGNGRQAVQSGADSVCPTLFVSDRNNRSTLGFDGGDFLGGQFDITLTQQTTFAVAKLSSVAQAFARLFTQSDAGNDFNNTGHYIPILRNDSGNALASWSVSAIRASQAITADAWFVFCSRHTGSVINNSVNGGSESSASPLTLNKTFTRYRVGQEIATTASAHWADRIAEVLVYNRSVSSDERQTVTRALGDKWGITVA
jgi:hypothetical protein